MGPIWILIGITALAGIGGTGLGGAIACLFRKDSDKTVSLLLSFAAVRKKRERVFLSRRQ